MPNAWSEIWLRSRSPEATSPSNIALTVAGQERLPYPVDRACRVPDAGRTVGKASPLLMDQPAFAGES